MTERAELEALAQDALSNFDDDEMPPATRRSLQPQVDIDVEALFTSPPAVMAPPIVQEMMTIVYVGNPNRYAGKYLTLTANGETYTLEDGKEVSVPKTAAEELLSLESQFYTIKRGSDA